MDITETLVKVNGVDLQTVERKDKVILNQSEYIKKMKRLNFRKNLPFIKLKAPGHNICTQQFLEPHTSQFFRLISLESLRITVKRERRGFYYSQDATFSTLYEKVIEWFNVS